MTNRLLPEDAVKALVQGKIDAAREKIERIAAMTCPNKHHIAESNRLTAAASALQTVITGLKWIESDDQRRMRVGGEFPLIEEAR